MKAELKVDALAHGGEGIARHEGRVVFVRGAAPGDRVEAELRGEGRFQRGRLLRVLERGPGRVEAPCGIVDRCGGCSLQHLSYDAQLAAKQELTADALERIGGIPRDTYELAHIVPSPQRFRYRRRARMHRARDGAWGFAQPRSTVVEPVDICLLFEPLLQDLAALLAGLPGATGIGLLAGTSRGAIDLRGDISRRRAERLINHPLIKGVTAPWGVVGDPVIADEPMLNGARLRTRPDIFAQANRSAVPLLQAEVVRALSGADRVLELFCGSGTLTLPLLPRSMTAVELAGPALQLLRRSADEAGLAVKLIAGDATDVAGTQTGPFDAVLLDPPRTGALSAVRAVAELRPVRIVYVSCDAPTLARDAKALVSAGYRLARTVPLDLFPQTAHFEIVATLELR